MTASLTARKDLHDPVLKQNIASGKSKKISRDNLQDLSQDNASVLLRQLALLLHNISYCTRAACQRRKFVLAAQVSTLACVLAPKVCCRTRPCPGAEIYASLPQPSAGASLHQKRSYGSSFV